jgi:hypothetical protein
LAAVLLFVPVFGEGGVRETSTELEEANPTPPSPKRGKEKWGCSLFSSH